jgi:Delta7-sterol 5-desaturase
MQPDYTMQYLTTFGGAIKDYLIFCGAAYLLLHFFLKRKLAHRKITQKPTGLKAPLQEIGRALISNLAGRAPLVVGLAYLAHEQLIPAKLIYPRIADHSWAYFLATIIFDVLFFDLWFYLSHRFLLHSRLVYKYIHIVHHRSVDPTPFARNSVHPVESVLNGIFHVLPVFIMPHHPLAILISTQLKGLVGITGHLGYEIFWSGFTRHWLGRYFCAPVHHHLHHAKHAPTNFAFLINYDLIFGTQNPDYHEAFETTVTRKEAAPALLDSDVHRGLPAASAIEEP